MSKYKKLAKNIALLTVGSFASKLLSFFFIPFYTIMLTTEDYGTADLIVTTVFLCMPVFTLSIREAMLRFALEEESDKKNIFMLGVVVNLVGLLGIVLFSPLILLYDVLRPYYLFFILYYISYTANTTLVCFARGINDVKACTISGVFSTMLAIALNLVFLLWFRWGINGYLLAAILSNFAASLLLFYIAKIYQYCGKVTINKSLMKDMIKYSAPLIPNAISWWISNSFGKYVLVNTCGVAVMGVYSIAYKIPTVISILSNIFMDAWRLSAVDDFGSEESKDFYGDILAKWTSLSLIAAAFLITFDKLIASFLYQKDFYSAWAYVPLLVIAVIIQISAEFYGSIYTSAKKTQMVFYSSVVGAVVNIILSVFLIKYFGGMGAVIATLTSYCVIYVIRIFHSRTIFKFPHKNLKQAMVCYALLLIQAIVVCMDIKNAAPISGLILAVIMLLNYSFIKAMLICSFRILKKKKGTSL
jgi:O-antigen/teichoic acid export membrane protein